MVESGSPEFAFTLADKIDVWSADAARLYTLGPKVILIWWFNRKNFPPPQCFRSAWTPAGVLIPCGLATRWLQWNSHFDKRALS